MRAMVLAAQAPVASSPLRPAELPLPEPGPGEVRVRVRACAACRTDLHVIEGDLPPRRLPLVPGHQAVGVVEALGAGASRLRAGDRVGIAWLRSTCGRCRFCVAGRENLCEGSTYTGWTHDGGYAEQACVPEAFAYRIPPGFDDGEAAPLLCAGIIGYRALRRSCLARGGRLGLYGFGSSAHVAIQVAVSWGCAVYVVTRDAAHRKLALDLGARWAGGPGEAPPDRVDAAIIFAPAGELVPAALEALDAGGTLALAGIHMTDVPRLGYERHLFREKTLRSVTANTREDGEALLSEAAAIPIRPRVTRYALGDANRALQDLARDRVEGTAVLVVE
ncbi:MAG: alcohol dehydrogenase [Candidatus Rokubacteria bacterium GWC2_70_16]|nr:MAG: alcohol dehydrogenase [Candidatus Rokubacteria bacterium GWC2_70_16]OGL20968.1 MAG: alcohol dehydrogenase [Candidatus Rokubacteria bacterium RIFCSPLOWO2_12_FULL_71_19]